MECICVQKHPKPIYCINVSNQYYIFFKLHETKQNNTTLFIANIRHNWTQEHLLQLFSHFGDVSKIEITSHQMQQAKQMKLPEYEWVLSYYTCSPFQSIRIHYDLQHPMVYLQYDTKDSVDKILKEWKIKAIPLPKTENGFEKYKKQRLAMNIGYSAQKHKPKSTEDEQDEEDIPTSSEMRTEYLIKLNDWFKEYDKKVDKEREIIDTIRNQKDEDGWTKVVAPKGKRSLPRLTAADLLNQENTKKRRKTKQQELAPNFTLYKFQKIEKQKEQFQLLREKFEAEKQKIEKLKQQNRFAKLLE